MMPKFEKLTTKAIASIIERLDVLEAEVKKLSKPKPKPKAKTKPEVRSR